MKAYIKGDIVCKFTNGDSDMYNEIFNSVLTTKAVVGVLMEEGGYARKLDDWAQKLGTLTTNTYVQSVIEAKTPVEV